MKITENGFMKRQWMNICPTILTVGSQDNHDEDEFVPRLYESGDGPTEEGVEEYKEQFAEDDPNEFENREEDGWDFDNWARDFNQRRVRSRVRRLSQRYSK